MKSVRQGKVWFWLMQRSQNHVQNYTFQTKRATLAVYHDILLGFDLLLGPLPQPKPHFPLTYGLHIRGAVRGK